MLLQINILIRDNGAVIYNRNAQPQVELKRLEILNIVTNPDKKHSDIYKEQISKYGKLVSTDFLKNLQDNYKNYKKDGD